MLLLEDEILIYDAIQTFKLLTTVFVSLLQPIGNTAERFHALCLKDSGVLYEDPYIQVLYSIPSTSTFTSMIF